MPRADQLYGRPWSKNEYAIVLDTYFRFRDKPRHVNVSYVQELSRILGRTPASIVMRLENYASLDPGESSKRLGLVNMGQLGIECFERWVNRQDHLTSVAEVLTAELAPKPNPTLFDEQEREVKRAFDKYELLDHLGDGGFGSVFSCLDVESGTPRAIKIIRTDRMFESDSVSRFRREIQVLQMVDHPNVIKLMEHNLNQEDRLPAFVMELAIMNLSSYLEIEARRHPGKRPVLCFAIASTIFTTMMDAVEVLHEHNPRVVHRDINPGNILLMADGRWVLADFGLAKFLVTASQGYERLTRTQVGLGTGFYAAPEQYRDLRRTDVRTDIYALGVVLWELFTSGWPPPDSRDGHLPANLGLVHSKATERDPDSRYQSVAELRDAFQIAAHRASASPSS